MPNNKLIVTPDNFSQEDWINFFHNKSIFFSDDNKLNKDYTDSNFIEINKIGKIEFPQSVPSDLGVYALKVANPLTERSSRKKQYDIARNIIINERVESGIFIFYEENKSFRLSFIYPIYQGRQRKYSNYKRNSFFVSKDEPNKTYILQMENYDMHSINEIKDMFSIEKVSNLFYNEFQKEFERLKNEAVQPQFETVIDENLRNDFALLFVLRIIFLGFVQKKGWLGNDAKFIRNYINCYDPCLHTNGIYQDLLEPLFFQALNSPHSTKNKFTFPNIPEPFNNALVNAPFLNGGLFHKITDFDTIALYITNEGIRNFVDFLFSYNFTLEENTLYDEELELNPEFLGIIFEKLINKQYGAIYTPQLEVDLMCRVSLVKFLQQNCSSDISYENLYKLFFREFGGEEEQTLGVFTYEQGREILHKLESITVCDPAVGSGAFAVGMLNVLYDTEEEIYKNILNEDINTTPFERKTRIIFQSLYGVEVQKWAVWITQLRLWISLFLEAEDELKISDEPLLPSFDFKIRKGDSLIQILGDSLFPVSGEGVIGPDIKKNIDKIKELKTKYYHNKSALTLNEIERLQRNLYINMLEKKKKTLLRKYDRLKIDTTQIQADFFSDEEDSVLELAKLNFEKSIKELELEIKKLDFSIDKIKNNDIPFIWRIDFPEIFLSKEGFDIVIGNPPYVAQEEITDPQQIIDNRTYKDLLKKMAAQDFPDRISENSISGKSDLYTFFYIRGLRLLNKKGILTFICSNSWMDVEFGAWLQKFLLENCQVYLIIDNLNKRVFRESAINTIISVISAPQPRVKNDDLIRFVAFKIPYESSIYTDNFLAIEDARKRLDIDDLRVNVLTRMQLMEEGWANSEENRYRGSKWGSIYIKAPDIYFTIIEKAKNKLVKLGDIAELKRGYTTGANEFFYFAINDPRIKLLGEDNFKDIIRSPRELKGIDIDKNWLNYKILYINPSIDILSNPYLFQYIKEGEKRKYHLRPTIKNRIPWYSLPPQELSDIVQGQIINDRFLFCLNQKYYADCVLNLLYLNEEYTNLLYETLLSLNASITILMSELNGRTALGEGALKTQVFELRNLKITDPKLIAKFPDSQNKIKNMMKREIYSVCNEFQLNSYQEIKDKLPDPLPDRKAIDDMVFSALELTPNERKAVYMSLLELTANRLNRANLNQDRE